ncbi:hypothetical protein FUA48_09635 [Flavobacterium alkalisoli]|uniref:Uncharacterized protein n=1 Tax=Flavobacterium alkalisoli TaxID=2602769 RepID=A0A5B9FUR5_9FLAO|nr:hypothetical protein [Flavobacterium alkalisoli]QEE49836.1 hypothetical protein FUA48_09635 [Flavobacterium alkalisoli]
MRNAENHGNGLLGYDSLFGVGTFKGKDSNKDGKISNKEKFADHPQQALLLVRTNFLNLHGIKLQPNLVCRIFQEAIKIKEFYNLSDGKILIIQELQV